MSLELAAGIDDVATERQLTSGWSFVVLPRAEVAQFAANAQVLLPSGVSEFHAAKLNAGNIGECQAYENFLRLLRKTAEAAVGCFLGSSLNNKSWDQTLRSIAAAFVPSVFGTLGVTDSQVVDGGLEAAPSLMTMVRLVKIPSATVSSLDIDQNTKLGAFAKRSVSPSGASMQATELLAWVVDGYRKHKFPASPPIDRFGMRIVDSANSFLVQAADVLGNFSMNFIIRSLGPTSPGRTKKAEIFENVFGDLLPGTRFGDVASLAGSQLELELQQPGALTFALERP